MTASVRAQYSATEVPVTALELKIREPSMYRGFRACAATSATASTSSKDHGTPPPAEYVFSTETKSTTSPRSGSGSSAVLTSPPSMIPERTGTSLKVTPFKITAAGPSIPPMCESSAQTTQWPGRDST